MSLSTLFLLTYYFNMEEPKDLIEIYRELRFSMPIVIGGSIALYLYGYDLKRPIYDLDLVIPEEINPNKIDQLHKMLPRYRRMDSYGDNIVSLKHDDTRLKVDFIFNTHSSSIDKIIKKESYKLSSLTSIVGAKIEYVMNGNRGTRFKHLYDLFLLHEQGVPGIPYGLLKTMYPRDISVYYTPEMPSSADAFPW